jgi:two-component system osmolarity sensor histidine kinase EnvZ
VTRIGAWIKGFLPRSLLGRSLMILLVPLVLLEIVALQIFYGSHLSVVSRRMSGAIASEIATTIALLQRFPDPDNRAWILRTARQQYEFDIHFLPDAVLPDVPQVNILGPMDDDLDTSLRDKLRLPLSADWTTDRQSIVIEVQLPDGVLHIEAPRKRLYTATIYVFVIWLVGTAIVVFTIAALFMRNQVRAIRRLAIAAEAFGMGRDLGAIRPEGASEVRQAATAFNRMQERIRRFLTQRTEMLAGVSHDLRTPLTRLRLALAMLPPDDKIAQDVADMTGDVDEMDRMIGGYLAFARGEVSEQAQPTDFSELLQDIAAGARRSGAKIEVTAPTLLTLKLRADAMRRAITNLVDNARRHASLIQIAVTAPDERAVYVTVDDNGPGIPEDRRESVFRPFESDHAGGTGLGLTIARDIVRAHGGDIALEDSPMGGLRARVRLPV